MAHLVDDPIEPGEDRRLERRQIASGGHGDAYGPAGTHRLPAEVDDRPAGIILGSGRRRYLAGEGNADACQGSRTSTVVV